MVRRTAELHRGQAQAVSQVATLAQAPVTTVATVTVRARETTDLDLAAVTTAAEVMEATT